MKKERNIEQEKAERIKKREYLKRLSKSLVARRDMDEYMGNETDTVNGLLRFSDAATYRDTEAIFSISNTVILREFVVFIKAKVKEQIARIEHELING